MPELPEVEVYAENLRPRVLGKVVASVETHHGAVLRRIDPAAFAVRVKGCRIKEIARRGKTLGFLLDSGDRLDVHLMLRGEIYCAGPGPATAAPEPCLALTFQDGARLVFSDPHYNTHRPQEPKMWIGINEKERGGVDPLDPAFTSEALAALCRQHKLLPIKALLTDQKLIGGLGNAYVDEILWAAGIRPRRVVSLMTAAEIEAVKNAIDRVLTEALSRTRQGLRGEVRGEVREHFSVHRRAGKPCPRCGTRIAEEYFRERATHWCPTCQT